MGVWKRTAAPLVGATAESRGYPRPSLDLPRIDKTKIAGISLPDPRIRAVRPARTVPTLTLGTARPGSRVPSHRFAPSRPCGLRSRAHRFSGYVRPTADR